MIFLHCGARLMGFGFDHDLRQTRNQLNSTLVEQSTLHNLLLSLPFKESAVRWRSLPREAHLHFNPLIPLLNLLLLTLLRLLLALNRLLLFLNRRL
jgi:hypothetical protein